MDEQTKEFEVTFKEMKDADDKHLLQIECDATDHEILAFLDRLTAEMRMETVRCEWASKWNSYVVYDYEPYCIEGYLFRASYEYTEENENKFAFMKQIVADWISKVNKLNKILALTV